MRLNQFVLRFSLILILFLISGCSLETEGRNIADTLGLRSNERFEVGESEKQNSQRLSFEAEYFLGRAAGANVLQRFKPTSSEKQNRYVQLVGSAVSANSDQPEIFGGYTFYVLEDPQPNAFSLPGGFVFITTGLLQKLNSEEELAGVLAHEISHIIHRDSLEFISQDKLGDYHTLGALAISAVSCDALSALLADQLAAAVNDLVDNLLNKGYSREKEFRADKDAAKFLNTAGYNPQAVKLALLRLESIERNSSGGLFDDHPSVEDRIAALNEITTESFDPNGEKIRTLRFHNNVN